jgi:hypothetical protein
MTIEEKLINLDINTKSKIRNGIDSIYKINKNDDSFKELIQKHVSLKDSHYIVYPNDNKSKYTLFLDKTGKELKKADFFANNLIYESLDFKIEYTSLNQDDDILQEYNNYSIFGD